MEFKIIENGEIINRKNLLTTRDMSTLEFQMRIFDLITLEQTPILEKLNFIKIIDSNLKEFISLRLPDMDEDEQEYAIHTIESIYYNMGQVLDDINDLHNEYMEPDDELFYEIKNKNIRYIYAGESDLEVEYEVQNIIKMKENNTSFSLLYSGEDNFIDSDADCIIHVPKSVLLIDLYVTCYNEKYKNIVDAKYPIGITKKEKHNFYNELLENDIMIRNPYDSYTTVLEFIDEMCCNENITSIFISLYRTAKDSCIIKSLIKAKELGKNVCVYIEPTARDNEKDNITNIHLLKEKGIFVRCNYYNYKVHAKMFCAIDRNYTKYVHVGTGNYNEETARFYTDTHLLTTNNSIADTILEIFMSIFKKKSLSISGKSSLVSTSPLNFRHKMNQLISTEMKKGENGRIFIKCNNLCDCAIIENLYKAASIGVKVYIICRTGCTMRPHENIFIRSKVGQYLEHDRFYIFGSRVFISSADLLLRNISKRVELLCELPYQWEKDRVWDTFKSIWNDEYIHELSIDGKWKI